MSNKQDAAVVEVSEPAMVAGLPVYPVLELAAHYIETGARSTILADQIRRITQPILAALNQSLAQPQAVDTPSYEIGIKVGMQTKGKS